MCSSHLLCISSVPGAKEDDYTVDEELNKVIVEESSRESNSPGGKRAEEAGEESVKNTIGSISFVSCATGEQSMQHQQEEGRRAANPPRMIFISVFIYLFIFISFLEGRTRLTKETATEAGTFYFFFLFSNLYTVFCDFFGFKKLTQDDWGIYVRYFNFHPHYIKYPALHCG